MGVEFGVDRTLSSTSSRNSSSMLSCTIVFIVLLRSSLLILPSSSSSYTWYAKRSFVSLEARMLKVLISCANSFCTGGLELRVFGCVAQRAHQLIDLSLLFAHVSSGQLLYGCKSVCIAREDPSSAYDSYHRRRE